MTASNPITRLIDDLAAHWTEPVLEILMVAGGDHLSVQSEIETWHTLNAVLRAELGWERAFRLTTTVSLSTVMEQALRRTVLVLARKHKLWPTSHELEQRIRQLIRDRRSTAAERQVFGELVRHPALRAAFKPPSPTDFVPRLRLSAIGG